MATAKKTTKAAVKKETKRTKKEAPFILDPAIVYVLTSRRWFVTKVEGVYPSRAKAEADQEYYSRVRAHKVWSISAVPFVRDDFDILIKGN